MRVNVHDLLEKAEFPDKMVYPGKRVIKRFAQSGGDHKSHCAIADWTIPERFRLELKPGLTGQQPPLSELKQYPVSFQAQTYLDIVFDTDEDKDDEESTGKGKTGGGARKPKKRALADVNLSLQAFGKAMEGSVPTVGVIEKFVVMGKELAKEAYKTALDNFIHQLRQAKVLAMDILKGTSDIIKKATPGGGLQARGDETMDYQYDAERTAPMFGGLSP